MVPSLSLLSCESSVSVKKTLIKKGSLTEMSFNNSSVLLWKHFCHSLRIKTRIASQKRVFNQIVHIVEYRLSSNEKPPWSPAFIKVDCMKFFVSPCQNENLKAYFEKVMTHCKFNDFYNKHCFLVMQSSHIVIKIC